MVVQSGAALAATSVADFNTLCTSSITFSTGSAIGLDTSSGDMVYSGNIPVHGGMGLTKLGANNLTLSGSNTYTGATTVNSGTLTLQNVTTSFASNIVDNATVAFDASVGISAGYSGVISGSGTLTKTGMGSLHPHRHLRRL